MLPRPVRIPASLSTRLWLRDRILWGKVPPSSPRAASSAEHYQQGSERQPSPPRHRLPPTCPQLLPVRHLLRGGRVPPRHRRPATLVGPKPLIEKPPASPAPGYFFPELHSPHRASARRTDDP